MANVSNDKLKFAVTRIRQALVNLRVFLSTTNDRTALEASARDLTFAMGRVLAGVLLVEHAEWALQNKEAEAEQDLATASRWCNLPEFTRPLEAFDPAVLTEGSVHIYIGCEFIGGNSTQQDMLLCRCQIGLWFQCKTVKG